MVVLTAAGGHKARLIRQILALGLCNAVVIDEQTAAVL
jgi:DNA-binding transcriptional regulator LsrR (DeoR family)